ncbi:PEP-CTERM sorting domain-containing protein [Candidatus Nitrospira bockiana]
MIDSCRLISTVGVLTCALLTSTLAMAAPFQVNPGALSPPAPQASFTASLVDFSYQATLNQQTTGGASTCTAANPCTFQQTGTASFSNFKNGFTTPVLNSGLNENPGYTLTGQFAGAGTAVPLNSTGLDATFHDFQLRLFADGQLIGQSTGLIEGQAHFFGPDLAKGDFHVRLQFDPVGGFLSGPFILGLNEANFNGNNTNAVGMTLGNIQGARLEGSGNFFPSVIPEPTTLLLLGSGLVGLGLLARRSR